jgi:hypothetical protein
MKNKRIVKVIMDPDLIQLRKDHFRMLMEEYKDFSRILKLDNFLHLIKTPTKITLIRVLYFKIKILFNFSKTINLGIHRAKF